MNDVQLTSRQQQILSLIEAHLEQTGFPPTRAEIAAHFGFRSANAAEEHLRALAKKGKIEMVTGTSRGIRLIPDKPAGLPLVGRVAAGNPVLAVENIEDYVAVDQRIFHPQADYLLRVQGDSMVNIGIMEGDLLAVHSCPGADPGQIVVARVDDEVTVKRLGKFSSGKHKVTLEAENDYFEPIVVDLSTQSFAIEGLAVGVIRNGM